MRYINLYYITHYITLHRHRVITFSALLSLHLHAPFQSIPHPVFSALKIFCRCTIHIYVLITYFEAPQCIDATADGQCSKWDDWCRVKLLFSSAYKRSDQTYLHASHNWRSWMWHACNTTAKEHVTPKRLLAQSCSEVFASLFWMNDLFRSRTFLHLEYHNFFYCKLNVNVMYCNNLSLICNRLSCFSLHIHCEHLWS